MYTNRENYLITDGNLPLVPSGTSLYNMDGTLNIVPGQMGFFNKDTHIASTNFTNVADIYLAVGFDTNGDGIAEEVRKGATDFLSCAGLKTTAKAPTGGCSEIWDFLFDCTTCEAEYGIKVQEESTSTESYFSENMLPTYPFHVITDCCGCDTCTTDHNCNEIVCKIIDQVNQTNNDAQSLLIDRDFNFSVERLYPTIYHLELPCTSGNCGAEYLCKLEDVVVSYNGVSTTILTPVANPTNPLTMLVGQTKVLEAQLNKGLKDNNIPGKFHVVQKCTNTCWEITFNSCATLVSANFAGVCVGQITVETPLIVETPTNCTDCGDAGTTTKTYSCGIRFIGKVVNQECGCFPPAHYVRNRGTKLRIFPTTGFDCNNWVTKKIQEFSIEQGQGVDLRWREYSQEVGGSGRAFSPSLTMIAPFGAHVGRIPQNITAKCKEYCQYVFQTRTTANPELGTGNPYSTASNTIVAIPFSDTTTKTQFETAINSWITLLNCPIPQIACN